MKAINQEIYLIRHGETEFNRLGIVQGRGVNSPLNDWGQKQAEAFFRYAQNIDFQHICASSLLRSQQTVAPFKQRGHDVKIFSELDEINWGKQEGTTASPGAKKLFRRMMEEWKQGNLDFKLEGGESPRELQIRQQSFIDQHLAKMEGKILICSHGRAMRSFICTLTGLSLSHMDQFTHHNLSLYRIRGNGHQFEIIEFLSDDYLKTYLVD